MPIFEHEGERPDYYRVHWLGFPDDELSRWLDEITEEAISEIHRGLSTRACGTIGDAFAIGRELERRSIEEQS